MTDTSSELRTVVVEREIPLTPEKIWRALTQPHLLEEWLMKNDFRPEKGHRFNFTREPTPEVNVVVDCEVLEVEQNRTLAYSWEAFGLESVVTFTLTPTATGTHLRVTQHGFRPDQEQAYRGSRASWTQFLAALDELLSRTD